MPMGFLVSKILLNLILPPSGIILLIVGGMLLGKWRRTAGRILISGGVLLLYLLSLPLTADLLIKSLESSYPPLIALPDRADAVVVLGGGVRDLSWVPQGPSPSGLSLARLVTAIEIARKLDRPLVISGGSGAIGPASVREADAMAATAAELGFPRDRIRIENRSRNTLENAIETGRIMPGSTVILVTSAFHMRRAAGMFRKQGFTVIPAPTGYLGETRPASWSNLLPRVESLATSSLALSERLSLFWYGLQKKI